MRREPKLTRIDEYLNLRKTIIAATVAIMAAFTSPVLLAGGIHIDSARIGCLRIQKAPNLTPLVRQQCERKLTCNYKAPTPKEYRGDGVHAATQTFCTQAMEIKYDCGDGNVKRAFVKGDAWKQPAAALICRSTQNLATIQPVKNGHLRGFVDLHTHPMANLAFGGKLIYGGVDIGSLLPADPHCHHNVRATSEKQALGPDRSTFGGWNALNNPCGDDLRQKVIASMTKGLGGVHEPSNAYGYPSFQDWPKWNDLTHQKMWVDWIHRAYIGGLRVMVALAVNNQTLGRMTAGPGDYPTDDKSSADLQLRELKKFVARHQNFMQVAYSAEDVHRIVAQNKLAVVLGTEIDHIGDFTARQHPTFAQIKAEIDRLYREGVRYIFPIHLVDNPFGGAAAYVNLFNVANVFEDGHPFHLVCAAPSDHITYRYKNTDLNLETTLAQFVKLGHAVQKIPLADCPIGAGEKNALGLTALGQRALKYMMRRGILIDIDHMDQKAANKALRIAWEYRYPVNSGHNGLRGVSLGRGRYEGGMDKADYVSSERQLTAAQYAMIGKLHGMAGVGSAKLNASQWFTMYKRVIQAMGGGSIDAGFGTDFNGLEFGMPPRPGSHLRYTNNFPPGRSGSKTWDYNRDGVAQYGMLWDFLQDVRSLPGGADMVNGHFMYGADYFYHTWKIAESRAAAIRSGHGIVTSTGGAQVAAMKPTVPIKPAMVTTHIGNVSRPTPSRADCVAFDPGRLAVRQIKGDWHIVQGDRWLFDFASDRRAAERAQRIISHYGMNKVCYVGRPHPNLMYLLVNGKAPNGSISGEDCIPIDWRRLSTNHTHGSWKIVQGTEWLLDFGNKQNEAHEALDQLKQHRFTEQCFVDRPNLGLRYFRR